MSKQIEKKTKIKRKWLRKNVNEREKYTVLKNFGTLLLLLLQYTEWVSLFPDFFFQIICVCVFSIHSFLHDLSILCLKKYKRNWTLRWRCWTLIFVYCLHFKCDTQFGMVLSPYHFVCVCVCGYGHWITKNIFTFWFELVRFLSWFH